MAYYACAEAFPKALRFVLLLLWLGLLICLLASTADNFFVPQLEALSLDLRLSEDVAGVTLLALGNGMPDVMTGTSAINGASDFSLTMGELFGAANFILTLVLGVVLLCSAGPTIVEPMPFMRDAIAYLLVTAFMLYVTWDGELGFREGIAFFALYVVYVAIVVLPSRRTPLPLTGNLAPGLSLDDDEAGLTGAAAPFEENDGRLEMAQMGKHGQGKRYTTDDVNGLNDDFDEANMTPTARQLAEDMRFTLMETDAEDEDEGKGRDDDPLEGLDVSAIDGVVTAMQLAMEVPFTLARHASIPAANWNRKRRRLAALTPICGIQIAMLSFGGWDAFQKLWLGLPAWACMLGVGFVLAAVMLMASTPHERPKWHSVLLVFAFASTIGWFNMLANECVAVLETMGLNFGISSSVLGITVLAMGNSVGDLVADTALARQGRSRTAVAGCFGSPLLSDLLGLGIALTSYTLSNGPLHVELSLQNKVAAGALTISVCMTTCAFAFNNFSCPRKFGFVLLALYSVSILVSVVIETQRSAPDGGDASESVASKVWTAGNATNGTLAAAGDGNHSAAPLADALLVYTKNMNSFNSSKEDALTALANASERVLV
eukprot:TRINITY_DN65873_c0_g1_i1.p1 TRINITY_DN65873_c0_g1~~TRINITY_DN65873_c0_g1_i1.p1  ORF type:complete len:694 (-),score=139.17 TRINITY_DN65873_c0_g1_i1:58-1869(-)